MEKYTHELIENVNNNLQNIYLEENDIFIKASHAVHLFKIKNEIKELMDKQFQEPMFIHPHSPIIESNLSTNLTDGDNKLLFLNIESNYVDILVFGNNNLQLCNTFTIKSSNDFIYFTIFVFEQMKLDVANVSVIVSGQHPNFDEMLNHLRKVDYASQRNLDKNMFMRLSSLDFVSRKENMILSGASGVGKSYLAQALGHEACMMEYRVLYFITARLFNRLKLSKLDGTYMKELNKIQKADLLILDDFGLQSFDNHAREALMDVIDDRYNQKSTIVASQIPVSTWYDIIGEGTIADAILDRLVNSSHRIDLKGESLRKGILKDE